MTQLSKYETVATCLKLCSQTRPDVQHNRRYYTAVKTCAPSISSHMEFVDKARYGELKAPSNLIREIRQATYSIMEVCDHDPSIDSIVICGMHAHAIVAYYVASCIQTLVACKNWQSCAYPGVLCITFGLPRYWHALNCAFEHWKIVMVDDWYVLSPFVINIRPSANTFWLGEVSQLTYVIHTVMSLFGCHQKTRNIIHYEAAWSQFRPGHTNAYTCTEDEAFDILIDPSSPTL